MDPLARHAQAHPKATALMGPKRSWSYGDLHRAVGRRRAALREKGVEADDRVALHLKRSVHTVLLLWALWRRGAVAVPLSPREPSGEIVARAKQVDATLLVTADASLAEGTGVSLRTCPPAGLEGRDASAPDCRQRSPDRPATIVYTSGSTGAPKAALHTWANHLYSAKGSNANIPLRHGDRWLLSLPLYHVGGLAILIRCVLAGAAVVVPSGAQSLAGALSGHAVTHVSMVATQFRRVLEAKSRPPASLRAVLLGGGPIPDALLEDGTEAGWPLHTTYGCTEMASQVTTTPAGAPLDTLRTAGRRLPHRRLRIADGEIFVAGGPLFEGYVTSEGIDDPRTEDGWYPTGDRGRIEADGRLRVQGRRDWMFVSGGENIQPEEIEEALEAEAAVERAVVVPVPDSEFGQRPVAFVRGRAETDRSALRSAVASRLPSFKIPDAFYALPEPETADGPTVDRERLREEACTRRQADA